MKIPILALVGATLLAAGCGGDSEPVEEGGLATTTTATGELDAPPPPRGPLDELVVEALGSLELTEHLPAPEVREVGAADARTLTYSGEGSSAVMTLASFPAPRRARAYAASYAEVLAADSDFEPRGEPRRFDGGEGAGIVAELDDGAGTRAVVWTSGPVFAAVLADRGAAATVLELAPYGGEAVAP